MWGAVVNPSWLLTTMCTVPPVRYPGTCERLNVSATTPWPANAASPCRSTGRTLSNDPSGSSSCLARTIPSTTGSTASRCEAFDAMITARSSPLRDLNCPVMPRWYFTSPDPCTVSGSMSPSNSLKMSLSGLPTTFASTFRRPRWDIPTTVSIIPLEAASSKSASSMGMRLSEPSSEKRLCPRYFEWRKRSKPSAALSRSRMCFFSSSESSSSIVPSARCWIQQRAEGTIDDELSLEEKKHILDRLSAAEGFERFLHSKYLGHKRFSLEGSESLIPMLDALFEDAASSGMIETVVGMSHRGRLNVLANVVGKPLKDIFREFEGDIDPDTVQGSGDVKYHLGMTGQFKSRKGDDLAVIMASNASHLEAVDPVVEGMVRAKQELLPEGSFDKVLPVLLHGDAAFAGQGVVAETFNLSQVPGYRTGGTVHIVVNNQLGFTTAPHMGRSSIYATDIAKMVQAPIFHVNGDDPEACVRVVRWAFAYRQAFGRDIVIDMICYRRYGHNEADEPAFTQPLMYSKIDERRSVRKLYTE